MDSRAIFHRGAPPQWLTPEGGVYLESTHFTVTATLGPRVVLKQAGH
jgi:hypothetical protein